MTRERELRPGREDPDRSRGGVVDEHRLREAELRRDRLAPVRLNGSAVEDDPQGVAATARGVHEHPQDPDLGHPPPPIAA
jgi:hypothetical protein